MDDLYFIQMEDGPVKIGRSANVPSRLSSIQCASPYKVRLLGVLVGCGHQEDEFHQLLRRHRMRGEWFKWTNQVGDVVETALAGGDWRALELPDPDALPDDWWIGSPLYEGRVRDAA